MEPLEMMLKHYDDAFCEGCDHFNENWFCDRGGRPCPEYASSNQENNVKEDSK